MLNWVKDLGERLKNEQQYKKYGYITKQDLIEIFKKRQQAQMQDSIDSIDQDLILLVQAPHGTIIDIPVEQYQ